MKIKTSAAIFAAALMAAAPFSVYAADSELVYDDFNKNDVNGEVGFVLPKSATGTFTITFDSPEGKDIPYYTGSIESGKDYAFKLEGRDNTKDDFRTYTLSVEITGGDYGRTSVAFTDTINGTGDDTFIIHDPHDNPDTYQKCVYKFTIDDKDTGNPWDVTASDATSKTVAVHLNASIMGDVTGNGIIDGVDASTVLTAYAKSSVGKDMGLSDLQQKMSDVNADKKIDSNDATIILSFYAYSSVDNEPMTLAEFIKARG